MRELGFLNWHRLLILHHRLVRSIQNFDLSMFHYHFHFQKCSPIMQTFMETVYDGILTCFCLFCSISCRPINDISGLFVVWKLSLKLDENFDGKYDGNFEGNF